MEGKVTQVSRDDPVERGSLLTIGGGGGGK